MHDGNVMLRCLLTKRNTRVFFCVGGDALLLAGATGCYCVDLGTNVSRIKDGRAHQSSLVFIYKYLFGPLFAGRLVLKRTTQ